MDGLLHWSPNGTRDRLKKRDRDGNFDGNSHQLNLKVCANKAFSFRIREHPYHRIDRNPACAGFLFFMHRERCVLSDRLPRAALKDGFGPEADIGSEWVTLGKLSLSPLIPRDSNRHPGEDLGSALRGYVRSSW